MIDLGARVTIHRPPGEVFAFLGDPTQEPKWQPDVVRVTKTSPGPTGRGSEFQVVKGRPGASRPGLAGVLRIVRWRPTSEVALRSRVGPVHLDQAYQLLGHGQSTRLAVRVRVQAGGLRRLFASALRRREQRRWTSALGNLKRELED